MKRKCIGRGGMRLLLLHVPSQRVFSFRIPIKQNNVNWLPSFLRFVNVCYRQLCCSGVLLYESYMFLDDKKWWWSMCCVWPVCAHTHLGGGVTLINLYHRDLHTRTWALRVRKRIPSTYVVLLIWQRTSILLSQKSFCWISLTYVMII